MESLDNIFVYWIRVELVMFPLFYLYSFFVGMYYVNLRSKKELFGIDLIKKNIKKD
jgi:hypothetical protein